MTPDTDLTRRIEAIIEANLFNRPTFFADGSPKGFEIVTIDASRAIASLIAEERASARREALEDAAKEIDCGCSYGPAVVKVCREYGHNCAARWQLCSFETCAAIEAAAIRSLAAKEAPKRAEVALPPEHQRVMRRALAASAKPMPKEADNDQ